MKQAPKFTCEGCGKVAERLYNPLSRVFNKRQRFCTIECCNKARAKSNLDPTFVCERCGKETGRSLRSDGKGMNFRQRFCSKSCANERERNRVSKGFVHAEYGYRYFSEKGKWVGEHRRVMEGVIGRPLRKGETVHHKNGDRLDNRPENLELWATNHGPGQRVADQQAWAESILKDYGPEPFGQKHIDQGMADVLRLFPQYSQV